MFHFVCMLTKIKHMKAKVASVNGCGRGNNVDRRLWKEDENKGKLFEFKMIFYC